MFLQCRVAVASACHFTNKKTVLGLHTEAVEKRHGQPITVASGSPSFLSDCIQYFHTCSRREAEGGIGAKSALTKSSPRRERGETDSKG